MGPSKTRKFTQSSGNRAKSKARQHARRLRMKIARWERYKNKGKTCSKNARKLSRANWDTSGLQEQLTMYKNALGGSKKNK